MIILMGDDYLVLPAFSIYAQFSGAQLEKCLISDQKSIA